MKFLRLAVLGLTFSSFSFAVNKDLVALQRDLEDKIDAVQQNLSTQIATLTGALTAIQNDSRRTADQVATLQEALSTAVARSLTPVATLNSKVDSTSEDVRSLRDALADVSARLERMDAKITDLKNQLQIMQNPPAAPSTGPNGGISIPGAGGGMTNPGGTASPGSMNSPGTSNPGMTNSTGMTANPGMQGYGNAAVPPAGMSADKTYTDARRDQQTGNTDLAYQEYQQYLTYFPNTELAPSAQYYIGEIDYNRGDYKAAVEAFDAVLERYPKNPKTADAHLMKGLALAKQGQRVDAAKELRALIQAYPNSEDARKAQVALRNPDLFPSAATGTRRTR